MSPEYAMQGLFSVKSDVFSFGVLLLEIVSGQKNSSFYVVDSSQDLLSYVSMEVNKLIYTLFSLQSEAHCWLFCFLFEYGVLKAWKLWTESKPLELVDSSIGDAFPSNEVLKCIHIGLLCVQEDAADRPTMSSVAFMLNSHSSTLDRPGPPPLVGEKQSQEPQCQATRSQYSVNELDASEIEPR